MVFEITSGSCTLSVGLAVFSLNLVERDLMFDLYKYKSNKYICVNSVQFIVGSTIYTYNKTKSLQLG